MQGAFGPPAQLKVRLNRESEAQTRRLEGCFAGELGAREAGTALGQGPHPLANIHFTRRISHSP